MLYGVSLSSSFHVGVLATTARCADRLCWDGRRQKNYTPWHFGTSKHGARQRYLQPFGSGLVDHEKDPSCVACIDCRLGMRPHDGLESLPSPVNKFFGLVLEAVVLSDLLCAARGAQAPSVEVSSQLAPDESIAAGNVRRAGVRREATGVARWSTS
eukprot:643783-Amphidinium_carterae.1